MSKTEIVVSPVKAGANEVGKVLKTVGQRAKISEGINDTAEFASKGKTVTKKSFWNRFLPKFLQRTKKIEYYPNSKVKKSEEILQGNVRVKLSKFEPDGRLSYLETFNPKTNRLEIIKYNGEIPEKLVKYGDVVHYEYRPSKDGGIFEEKYFPERHLRQREIDNSNALGGGDYKLIDIHDNGNYTLDIYPHRYGRLEKRIKYDKISNTKVTQVGDKHNPHWIEFQTTEVRDANNKIVRVSKVRPFSDGHMKIYEMEVDKLTGKSTENWYWDHHSTQAHNEGWWKMTGNVLRKKVIKDKDGNIIEKFEYDKNGKVTTHFKKEEPKTGGYRGNDKTAGETDSTIKLDKLNKKWNTGIFSYSVEFLNNLETISQKVAQRGLKSLSVCEQKIFANEIGISTKQLSELKDNKNLYKELIRKYHPDLEPKDEVRNIITSILNRIVQ